MPRIKKKTFTSRSVKVGKSLVTDVETGDLKEVPRYEIRDVDINWDKVWLSHMLEILDLVGNKKMQVISWLLENRIKETNEIFATQDMIVSETKLSKKTVQDTFKALQNQNVLTKIRNGAWQLSPDFIWRGDSKDRMDILISYKQINEKKEKENE